MFFSFRLKLFVQASSVMSWGRQFQAFGADMRKALSPNFSLDRGVNSSSSVADRRTIDREHAVVNRIITKALHPGFRDSPKIHRLMTLCPLQTQ